jgi:hypothetical protein
MIHFNGWSRLAIVFCAAWLGVAIAMAGMEYATSRSGAFVELGPPVGSVVSAGSVTLPNGRIIKLQGSNSARPWAINWSLQPGFPVVRSVRWGAFVAALLFPFALCAVLFLAARLVRWVKAGFSAPAA